MAGVEDEDEFKDALAAAHSPPCSQSPKPASNSKPATAGGGGGLGRRLFASIPLPGTLSAAIGRFSSPNPPASNVGLGLLLDAGAGPAPSADGPPASDAASGSSSLHLTSLAALQRQHGDDQVAGRGAGVGEEELGLVPAEEGWETAEDSREKEGLAFDGRFASRNCFPTRDEEEEEGEQGPGDELGAAVAQDQEVVVEQQGATEDCTAVVEDECNAGDGDETRAVKDINAVEVNETVINQECAGGILDAAEDGPLLDAANDGAPVESQEDDLVVAEQNEDAISSQDPHKVVDQSTGDQLRTATDDNAVQDLEVVEQEGKTECCTAVEAVEQYSDDGSKTVKDDNIVEEEKGVEEGAVGVLLDAAKDGAPVDSQEDDLVVAEQNEDVISSQDQHKVVEQSSDDGSTADKDGNVVEEKEKAVEKEVSVGVLDAAMDCVTVEPQEENVVVAEHGEDGLYVQDQHKVVEQCTSGQLRATMDDYASEGQGVVEQCTNDKLRATMEDNAAELQELVEQEGAIFEKGVTADGITVEDQDKEAEPSAGDESSVTKGENSVEDKKVDQVINRQGTSKEDSGVEPQEEENVVDPEQGVDDLSVLDEGNVVAQCTSDQLRTTMEDNAPELQEAMEQEGAIFEKGVASDGITVEDQDKEMEQSAGDESRAKGGNAVEDKKVYQEDAIDKQGATKDGSGVESQEENMVVPDQGMDGISVLDEGNVVQQCTSDQLRTTTDNNAAVDPEVVEQEGVGSILGSAKVSIAMEESLEEDVMVAEQVEDGVFVQDQDEAVEQHTSDQLRTITDDNAVEDQEVHREKIGLSEGYPQRPGKLNCRFYMSTGSCSYGSSCHFNHPRLKAKLEASSFPSEQRNHEVEFLELNSVGLPIREGARNCTYYMRNGTCRYGKKCFFNHPEQVLDVQLHTATGWDDTNLQSSPHSKKSPEHGTMDDISSGSEILPPNILRMLLPPQNVPPTEEKELGIKKDPDWASASDDSDGCCSADSSDGPLCKQEHGDYPERPECPFILKFGNCRFGSSCQYYHPKDKFPSTYHPKDKFQSRYHPKEKSSRYYPKKEPALPGELMVYPDRPGEPECPFYVKTGSCKFGQNCKFHHLKDITPSMQGPASPKRSVAANEDHPTARTTLQDHTYQQQKYPERPGQPDCRYYMQFGKCKFQSACIFNHPKDILSSAWHLAECPFYMKTGTCQFGSACEFYHPKDRCSSRGGVIDGTDYGHDFATKSQSVLQQREQAIYPERPGELECPHYMKHGYCKFQMNCKFHHPRDHLPKK